MKKLFIFPLILFGFFTFVSKASAEQVNAFKSEVLVQTSGVVKVHENIEYDFGTEQKHGILRSIPIKYDRDGFSYKIVVENINVSDGFGNALEFTASKSGNDLAIQIGSDNNFVTGKQVYLISYEAKRVINFFDDHDELYWNVTGNSSKIPILFVSAEVQMEGGGSPTKAVCYKGVYGAVGSCIQRQDGSVYIFEAKALQAGEGLSFAYAFSKGFVPEPSTLGKVGYVVKDNFVLVVPVLVFVLMFYLWYTRGRDPRKQGTIIPQYEPPSGMTPLEIGVLLDDTAHSRDVAAEIIYLATLGYLKIEKQEKKKLLIFPGTDYKLQKLKSEEDLQNAEDKHLMKLLFEEGDEIWLSSLKRNRGAALDLEVAKGYVYDGLVIRGYFVRNPRTTKMGWTAGGFFGGIALVFLLLQFGLAPVPTFIAGVISGLVVIVFGLFMPANTIKGVRAKEHILGLKEYIKVAEKDRLAFHNAPEKTPERFEKLLPFAMALGQEKQWAKIFEGVDIQSSWYNDSRGHGLINAYIFADVMKDFSSSVSAATPSRSGGAGSGVSGFGGGGFSGGGFGGGGVGSW